MQKVIHAEQTAAEKLGIDTYDSLHHVKHLPGLLLLPPPSAFHVTQYAINNANSCEEAVLMSDFKENKAKLKKGWAWIHIAEVYKLRAVCFCIYLNQALILKSVYMLKL